MLVNFIVHETYNECTFLHASDFLKGLKGLFSRINERVSTEALSATATLKPGISFLWKQPHITFSLGNSVSV